MTALCLLVPLAVTLTASTWAAVQIAWRAVS